MIKETACIVYTHGLKEAISSLLDLLGRGCTPSASTVVLQLYLAAIVLSPYLRQKPKPGLNKSPPVHNLEIYYVFITHSVRGFQCSLIALAIIWATGQGLSIPDLRLFTF